MIEFQYHIKYINDTAIESPPPDEFYKFFQAARNTRSRLVKTNKDLFIIWGQNGVIGTFFIVIYFIAWMSGVGQSKKTAAKIFVFIQRQFFLIFVINLQLLSLTELALHDISKKTQGKFIYSYILSWTVTSIITLEFIRAWQIVRGTKETVEELKQSNYEKGMIKAYWTRHLDNSEVQKGNTFMIRDRARWTVFQISLVGLQKNSVMQICLITGVQILYIIVVSKEVGRKKVLSNFGLNIQYFFTELAILVFLLVLCIFSFLQNTDFQDSRSYSAMQTIVIVAVFVAISTQVISVVWGIFHKIVSFFEKRKKKKTDDKLKKIEQLEKANRDQFEEFDKELGLNRGVTKIGFHKAGGNFSQLN